jgi:hypothetical protein
LLHGTDAGCSMLLHTMRQTNVCREKGSLLSFVYKFGRVA